MRLRVGAAGAWWGVVFLLALGGCLGNRPSPLERDGGGAESGAGGAASGGAGGTSSGAGGGGGNGNGSGGSGVTGAGGLAGLGGTGGTLTPTLSGTTTKDFGNLQIGVASAPFTWTLKNAMGAPTTGALNLSNDDPLEVGVTNNCVAPLAGNASCTVSITFTTNGAGARTAHLTMAALPGGSAILTMTAVGQEQITVTTAGTGTVTSVPAGISCPGTCAASFSVPSVTLQARTTNGASSFFSGWSDPGCPGPLRDCVETVNRGTVALTATFSAMNANLVFVTSAMFPTNVGSAIAYDTVCNTAASAAGINVSSNDGYVAMISDAISNAISRLGSAQGWLRMDNKPFADTQTGLFTNNHVFYPIAFDETGRTRRDIVPVTATLANGKYAAPSCKNWTDTTDTGIVNSGNLSGGPYGWLDATGSVCNYPVPVICMGKSKTATVAVTGTAQGRRIWISGTDFMPNDTTTPDAVCQADRPASVTNAAAFISTSTKAAAMVIDSAMSYYRPDNIFVGTGADLLALTALSTSLFLPSGIWQSGDGTYHKSLLPGGAVWVGSVTPNDLGTTASTCGDWTDPTQPGGFYGDYETTSTRWWSTFSTAATCAGAHPIYCVQTAP